MLSLAAIWPCFVFVFTRCLHLKDKIVDVNTGIVVFVFLTFLPKETSSPVSPGGGADPLTVYITVVLA